jgi:uncharacterized protein (DUF488 family)
MDLFSSGTLRRQTPAVQVYTIGHGTRPLEELVAALVEAGARTLVDVRRFPGSRRNPQFNQDSLAGSVEAAGIAYRHAPELGGRRSSEPGEERFACIRTAAFRSYAARMTTAEWQAALARELESPALCFLCAETLPWRCHRHLIAETLHARGLDIVHVIGPGEAVPHKPWPQAETRDGRLWLCGTPVA